MGGAVAKINQTSFWHAKPHPLNTNGFSMGCINHSREIFKKELHPNSKLWHDENKWCICWEYWFWIQIKIFDKFLCFTLFLNFKNLLISLQQMSDSPQMWLHNSYTSNPSKQILETYTVYSAAHNIHGKVWMKDNIHGFTDNKLLSVKQP